MRMGSILDDTGICVSALMQQLVFLHSIKWNFDFVDNLKYETRMLKSCLVNRKYILDCQVYILQCYQSVYGVPIRKK
jgi:hypothetical protein